ncbi:MAG: WD40 repeat domain-containing protein, partial [archaeon]|nr:WD40 repeat domain-containing protein [archaeon]
MPDSFEPQRQNHQAISFSGFSSSTPPLIPLQQLIDQSHHLDGLHHHSQANHHHSAPSSLPPGRHLAGELDGDEKSWRRRPSTEPNADLSAGGRRRRFWNKILVLPGSGDVLLAASCGRVGLFSATETQLTDALVPQSSRTAGEPLSLAYCRRRERAFVGYSSGLVASFALGKAKEWTRSSKEGGDEGEVEAARRNGRTSGREPADVDDDEDVDDVDDKHDVDDEDGKREGRELVAMAEFKGHTQAVLYVDIPHRFEVLLTGSKDGTVRQWHQDLAREIKGYSIPLFATALFDPRRSVLVVGTSAGSLFSYQLERAGTGLESFFTAKGISPPVVPFPGVNPPVDILSYLSSSDSLLLGSSVPGCHALHCRPFLNKPITENSSSSSSSHSSHSSVSHPVSPLFSPSSLAPALPTSDPIKTDGVLHEMQSRVPPSARVDDMTHFQAKRRLLPLFLSLYETPSSAAALELQNAPDRIEKELHVSLLSRYAQQSKTRKGLLEDHRDILDPEHTVERIRTTYQHRLELLQERHRLELAELEEDLQEELAQFRQQLPSRREHLAQEYLETRETACRFEQFIDKAAASKLNECLRKSHPVISERYMVGKKIRSGVSSVFLGIDLHVMRHVAIKAVASFIPINTGLQHPGLCPILDVLKTPG